MEITEDWKNLFISFGFAFLAFIGYEHRFTQYGIWLFIFGVFGAGYYFRKIHEYIDNNPI